MMKVKLLLIVTPHRSVKNPRIRLIIVSVWQAKGIRFMDPRIKIMTVSVWQAKRIRIMDPRIRIMGPIPTEYILD